MLGPHFARGPGYAELRPLHPSATSPTFPVYDGPAERLLSATDPDDMVRHVLAVCAGYAYSDQTTVATMMARLGLAASRLVMVREVVDAMFICSSAYVIQSDGGRVVILCYRGTEPANLINWLTNLDVDPDQVRYDLDSETGDESYRVHAGFYRNVRATRYAVIDLLNLASQGRSIIPGDNARVGRMEALYITGHSLGAAMAAMMTVMLHAKEIYAPIAAKLKATYTYGQPMIGTGPFAAACSRATFGGTTTPLSSALFRYVYADDVVPQLPPRNSGSFAHFGTEFRCSRIGSSRSGQPTWPRQAKPMGQTNLLGVAIGGLALMTRQLTRLRGLPLHQSIVDHGPQNYVAALTPPEVRTEFGD